MNCSLQKIFVTNITFERLVRIVDRRFGTRNCLYQKHFLVWPRVGYFKEQVFRAYLNSIWMTLCTPRCKSTTPGCYFYVFLLMVRNSTLGKKCFFYDSFFLMLLWHGADFTIDQWDYSGTSVFGCLVIIGEKTCLQWFWKDTKFAFLSFKMNGNQLYWIKLLHIILKWIKYLS